jgi:hypothetical protein
LAGTGSGLAVSLAGTGSGLAVSSAGTGWWSAVSLAGTGSEPVVFCADTAERAGFAAVLSGSERRAEPAAGFRFPAERSARGGSTSAEGGVGPAADVCSGPRTGCDGTVGASPGRVALRGRAGSAPERE